jgi:arginase
VREPEEAAIDITVIEVPEHAGDSAHVAAAGPVRLIDAGALDVLAGHVHHVTLEVVAPEGRFRDTASSAASSNRRGAQRVRAAVEAGRVPIVFAGSCVTALGVLAGFDRGRCGAVGVDAHADFNTPESISGFFRA